MELRYLTTFVAVAETGSMTAASMRCNITQAAVSQQIKSLEDEFGIKLLQRDKDLKLTDAGKALYEKAKKMTSIAYEIKQAHAFYFSDEDAPSGKVWRYMSAMCC